MEVTFLGTASHTPTAKRNHTGILVELPGEMILVDCGEGMQRQFKMAKKNACKLTKLCITHWHGDHTLGIPGLMQSLAMAEYSKELHIFGPRGTKKKFALLEQLYGRFKINHVLHEITSPEKVIVDEDEWMIEASSMQHGVAAYAYAISSKEKRRIDKEKLAKYKIGNSPKLKDLQAGKDIEIDGTTYTAKDMTYMQEGKKVAIVMDTAPNQEAIDIAQNADVLVIESTYHTNEEQLARERDHLTTKDAATIAKKAKVKQMAITHLSHRYAARPKEILDEARKVFKNTMLPRDLDSLTV